MPYKEIQAQRVYEPEEYPKMLTNKAEDGSLVPMYYPVGHEKQGLPVIFENADEEAAYFKPRTETKAKAKAKKDD